MASLETLDSPVPARQGRLRFGIMLDHEDASGWIASCLEQLLATPNVELGLVIVNAAPPRKSAVQKLISGLRRENWKFFLANIYFGLLLPYLSRRTPTPHKNGLLESAPVIRCTVRRRGRFSEYFSDADVETIRSHDLDFILRCGFGIVRGAILKVPRYGVWSFHHDDHEKYRGGPAAFWEMYFDDPVTGSMLQRLTDRLDAGTVLYKGYFKTLTSYARNQQQVVFGGAPWPSRVCKDILNGNADYVDAPPSATTAPIYRTPTNAQMARFLTRTAKRFLWRACTWPFRTAQWNIGIVPRPIHTFIGVSAVPDIRWLPDPPRTEFVADPFGAWEGDDLVIMCEHFNYARVEGNIASIRLASGRKFQRPTKAIDTGSHLSYPFLIRDASGIYCVPESSHARNVQLWKAVEFPTQWECIATVVDNFRVVDPTIFHHNGYWWLFGVSGQPGPSCTLYAWYADRLEGPWHEHAANPLKVDIRSAQPGGTPFVHDGILYRPGQDGSLTYGGSLALNRVDVLTPTAFQEETIGFIRPVPSSRFPCGIHTMSAAGDVTIVDGHREIFSPTAVRRTLHDLVGMLRG